MAHDVFISYAIEDRQTADMVCRVLEKDGIACWYAPRDVPFGADYEEAIVDAISDSRLVLLILSAHSNNSAHVRREIQNACAEEPPKPILPVRIEDVPLNKALRYYLSSAQWLDASTPPVETYLPQLVEQLRARLPRAMTEDAGAPRQDAETKHRPAAENHAAEQSSARAAQLIEAERVAIESSRRHGTATARPVKDEESFVRRAVVRLREFFTRPVQGEGAPALLILLISPLLMMTVFGVITYNFDSAVRAATNDKVGIWFFGFLLVEAFAAYAFVKSATRRVVLAGILAVVVAGFGFAWSAYLTEVQSGLRAERERRGSVSGTVLLQGRAAPGVGVQIWRGGLLDSRAMMTDALGKYNFSDLYRGTRYTIYVGSTSSYQGYTQDFTLDEPAKVLDIKLQPRNTNGNNSPGIAK